MAEVSGAAEPIKSPQDWTPKERTLPVMVEVAGKLVQLVVRELSIVQRDAAVGLLLDGVSAVAKALASLPGDEGGEALRSLQSALTSMLKGDGEATAMLADVAREVLASKVGELTCTILANRRNAEALGMLGADQPMNAAAARATVELLRGELPASAEPVVLQAWWEVEDVAATLGNWQALWTQAAGPLLHSEAE
jgi:hypothetical protein